MTDTTAILRKKLKVPTNRLASLNKILLDPKNSSVNDILAVIAKHGSIEEINRKSEQARKLSNLMATSTCYGFTIRARSRMAHKTAC